MILQVLCKPPFEYLEEVPGRLLTIKTVFLLAISSLKKVSDLQALSMAHLDLEFAPGMAKAFLYPRPGYIPKVSVVCEHWMDNFFLFVCYGPPKKGLPATDTPLAGGLWMQFS